MLINMYKREIKDLGFASISHRKDDSQINDYIRYCKVAYHKCKTFFEIKTAKVKIIIVYNETEYKKNAKSSYYKGGTGAFLMPNVIILKSSTLMGKTTGWKKEQLVNVITNGFAKAFYCSLVGSWKPLWLSGGIAVYLMGNYHYTKSLFKKEFLDISQDRLLQFNYVKKTYSKYKQAFYPFGLIFTEYLIKKFGRKKLILLLKEFSKNPRKKNFNQSFTNVYGQSPNSLAKLFIKT